MDDANPYSRNFTFLGGAHDTGLVEKHIHSGLVYGFAAAVVIGFVRQWYFLESPPSLKENQALATISDQAM